MELFRTALAERYPLHLNLHCEVGQCTSGNHMHPGRMVAVQSGLQREAAMDAVGIAERTRPPATAEANGRAPEPDHFTDPAMTRAARKERAARRRAAPAAWRLELRDLYHYTADYPYDPDHEYAWGWTTDPDYGTDSVRLFRFDADGVMDMADNRARDMQRTAFHTSVAKLGDCVARETAVHYKAADDVVRQVVPDLMVLPQVGMLGMATGRERALRLDRGQPPPDLALEILSFGGAQRDLEHKRRLYAELGIREYLVYDLGDKRRRGSPRELLMFRLDNGAYRKAEPEPKESDADPEEYWSDVFGAYIRMMPDPREAVSDQPAELRPPPRFQWWDATESRWRDDETDRDNRLKAEGVTIGEARMAINALHMLLAEILAPSDRDRVAAVWREHGPPTDAMDRLLAVRETPDAWRSLLLPN